MEVKTNTRWSTWTEEECVWTLDLRRIDQQTPLDFWTWRPLWAGWSLQASHVEKADLQYVFYVWTKLFNKILYRLEYYIIASPSNIDNEQSNNDDNYVCLCRVTPGACWHWHHSILSLLMYSASLNQYFSFMRLIFIPFSNALSWHDDWSKQCIALSTLWMSLNRILIWWWDSSTPHTLHQLQMAL
jgi:hypothetical protein